MWIKAIKITGQDTLYKKINSLSKDFKPKESFFRNKNGTLLTNRDNIVEKWTQYFDQLLNCREPVYPFFFETIESNREEHTEPTIEEILNHIKALKNHKAPGEDGITKELLKIGTANRLIYRNTCID